MLQVDVLLDCTDILVLPVESVLKLPKPGDKVVCKLCKKEQTIKKVGQPYRTEHNTPTTSDGQARIGGE